MQVILHRGNTSGSNKETENNPKHIKFILSYYDCEVDVWRVNGDMYLGHDKPLYPVDNSFFNYSGLWCHAKNLGALHYLTDLGVTCFYHNVDDFTLTSNKYIWTYPGKPVVKQSIIVDLSKDWRLKNYNCYGVCVDYII